MDWQFFFIYKKNSSWSRGPLRDGNPGPGPVGRIGKYTAVYECVFLYSTEIYVDAEVSILSKSSNLHWNSVSSAKSFFKKLRINILVYYLIILVLNNDLIFNSFFTCSSNTFNFVRKEFNLIIKLCAHIFLFCNVVFKIDCKITCPFEYGKNGNFFP